ncbi:uncharacterized protein [Montipora capricornis]|uniref:uncharacterized protein n=1 Tax=Montipora capricornis TaxID=246305 RepID=UPI0035F1C2D5
MHAPNFSGARIPIQSNFNSAQFGFYVEHYQHGIIVDFLRYGWPINYVGSLPSSTLSNHPSAAKNSVFLRSYVHKELVHRSICGPFTSNPFDTNCVISPLLCVPKRDSDELRVVHDLSFPEGFSVNDGIAKNSYLNEPFRLRLPGIDRLVEFVNKEGSGCHVFKKDLSHTYRQIPVDPGDYHLLGFQVDGHFYFHSAFPFGLRSATLACQRTAQSVVYILNTMGILVDVYIDDFYGACRPSHSHSAFQRMNTLFDELGLLTSAAKDVPPCYRMVCLGVEIDTFAMTLTVPQFRLDELDVELHQWLEKSTYTKHALQSLLGKLSYVSACVRPGRVYMCRLLNALRDTTSRRSARRITDDMRADIAWWIYLLQHYNGVSVILSNVTISNPYLFACDACLSGCVPVCFGEYFKRCFPPAILAFTLHINVLELLTVVVTVKLWATSLQGLNVELHSDNTACIAAINNKSSSNVHMQCCLHELWLILSVHNIFLVVHHVPSKENSLADSLNRYNSDFSARQFVDNYAATHELVEISLQDTLFSFFLL